MYIWNGFKDTVNRRTYICGCISMQRYWSSLRYSFLRTVFVGRRLRRHPITLPVLLSNICIWTCTATAWGQPTCRWSELSVCFLCGSLCGLLLAALCGPLCGGPLLCGPLCGSSRRLLLAAFCSASLRHSFSVICLSFAASAAVLSHKSHLLKKGKGAMVHRCPVRLSLSKSRPLFQSNCTTYFGAVTHNERRFQFRLSQLQVPNRSGFMDKPWVNRWLSPSERDKTRSCTWAKQIYL